MLPLGAPTLEACGYPHLAQRCRPQEEQIDQRFAQDMVALLREALQHLCEQLRDAQSHNEQLEQKCAFYDAQLKQAGVTLPKASTNGEPEWPRRPDAMDMPQQSLSSQQQRQSVPPQLPAQQQQAWLPGTLERVFPGKEE